MIYIPKYTEELEKLRGKLTRVITPSWGNQVLIYYNTVNNDYEFMKQWSNWIFRDIQMGVEAYSIRKSFLNKHNWWIVEESIASPKYSNLEN